MIPKIIHQTAPIDKRKWHSIWIECQNSWKKNFLENEYDYFFWDDNNIRNLVKNNYPKFLKLYDAFPYHIMRVDFSRFCMLHKYGGIYSDMDIFCYKNFYNMLNEDLYIVESWLEWGETLNNSLMVSSKGNDFWIDCMNTSLKFYEDNLNFFLNHNKIYFNDLCISLGPNLFEKVNSKSKIFKLTKELFNPRIPDASLQFNRVENGSIEYKRAREYYYETNKNETHVITRHYLTGSWHNQNETNS